MKLRAKVSGVVLIAVAAAGVLPAAVAQGSPLSDKQAQAKRARSADPGQRLEDGRALREAERRRGSASTRRRPASPTSERRTAEAQAATDKIHDQLNARAAEIYKGAGTSNPLDAVDVENVTELAARSKYASAAADKDDSLLEQAAAGPRGARDPEGAARDAAQRRGQAERDAADRARRELEAVERPDAASCSARSRASSPRWSRQERARQAAASRARAQAQTRSHPLRWRRRRQRDPGELPERAGTERPRPQPPWPSPRRRSARATRYATSGPDTFDCSGLTAAAWGAAGVGLAHYSGAQYQQTIRIGPGDLQPGDLVFYGPGGSNHVEIYIGGGMVVSASNPATGVKLAGVRYGSASGYGRVG